MIQDVLDAVKNLFVKTDKLELNHKTNKFEIYGKTKDGYEILTVQAKHYLPYDQFGEHGYFYESKVKRKVRDKERNWIYIEEIVDRYRLSEGDMRFIYEMYVHGHLTAEQINLISGIPQPYIFRYIKHKKLKPIYTRIPRSEIKKRYTADDKDEIEIDFTEEFNIDPYPTRSEWKVRREELGLKNGENWRNSDIGSNPGPKKYGSGKTSAKKKLRKLERKEERKRRNIQKFNSHQNNRYGITEDNPEGVNDPYKKYRDDLTRKKNGECKKEE